MCLFGQSQICFLLLIFKLAGITNSLSEFIQIGIINLIPKYLQTFESLLALNFMVMGNPEPITCWNCWKKNDVDECFCYSSIVTFSSLFWRLPSLPCRMRYFILSPKMQSSVFNELPFIRHHLLCRSSYCHSKRVSWLKRGHTPVRLSAMFFVNGIYSLFM